MTDKDLNALVDRIAEGIENDASWPFDGQKRRDAADALDALVAEVERLRGERAAVVAYLRAEASLAGASPDERTILRWVANYIDRGEHRREGES